MNDYKSSIFGLLSILAMVFLCFVVGSAISSSPYLPLILIVSVCLFFFAFLYTEKAMVLLIIAMLLSPEFAAGAVSSKQNIVVRIDDLLIVVFMLAWLARSALSKNTRFINKLPINRFIFFYTLTFIVSTSKGIIFGQVTPIKGMFYAFKYIEYFMFFYLAAGVIRSKEQVINYIKVFIFVLVIVNIYAMTQIGQDRVSAPFEGKEGEPNTLGGYQVLILSIILGLILYFRSSIWKWVLLGVCVLTMIPFTYTESRSSYAAFIVMFISLIFFVKGAKKKPLIGAMIILTILAIFFTPPVIKERVLYTFIPQYDENIQNISIGSVTLDPSSSARINDYMRLWDKWKKEPLLGYGVTGAGFVDGQFIVVLVESGLLGLIAFLLMLFQLFKQVLRVYKGTKDEFFQGLSVGFLSGALGLYVHALTANTFILVRIMEPFWFLAAIILMIPKLEGQNPVAVVKENITQNYITNASFLLKNNR